MAFKPIDPKRDEYRRYLERGGIIESLTKVFVRILKERPEDPTQYLLQNLGDARLQADNIAYLQSELEDARNEIQRLTEIIRGINPDLLVEPPSNNDSNSNDNLNESIAAKDEAEDATLQTSVEQNPPQPIGEYSEVVALEEGLQNTHIVESNAQAVAGGDAVQNEIVSSAD
ncbi:c-Myc-binding protein homolog [Calliphora vicina]|uniref:c-Myc-binding protein homolog n=1 Tax=Calliphora vicina TaxID=7373 RepID=UPI00325B9B50